MAGAAGRTIRRRRCRPTPALWSNGSSATGEFELVGEPGVEQLPLADDIAQACAEPAGARELAEQLGDLALVLALLEVRHPA